MKRVHGLVFLSALLVFGAVNQSCKPKKVLVNRAAEIDRKKQDEPEKKEEVVVTDRPTQALEMAPTAPVETAPAAPNYNFKNIQFELDSYVLKTESYTVLDQIYREMRKDLSAKFTVEGHASVEGSADYNQKLSIDRANAVKIYLVNSGINAENLTVRGYGATRPLASNDTESGRTINRRVEIKIIR